MDYEIRRMKETEYALLRDFLYEAIFIPEGVDPPPRSIVDRPELQIYISDFGRGEADICLLAVAEGRPLGAAWSRIMDDYGHLADGVPSLAIALYREYRGQGIGSKLLAALLDELRRAGWDRVSLSVQKDNRAVKLYRRLGFETVTETDEEYLMLKHLGLENSSTESRSDGQT